MPVKTSIYTRLFGATLSLIAVSSSAGADKENAVEIGSRLELFVDNFLVEKLDGTRHKLHSPAKMPSPKSPLPNRFYTTILKDGDLFRAYWRDKDPTYPGSVKYFTKHPEELAHYEEATGMPADKILAGHYFAGHPGTVVRYAESRDGHEWTFPELGLCEVAGTRKNNVVLANMPPLLSNFTPFIDTNPDAVKGKRYKALGGHPGYFEKRGEPGRGLHAFVSEDGFKWETLGEVILYPKDTNHAFDSQNVAFWSEAEKQYLCYFRTYKTPWGSLPSITRVTSPDFINWSEPEFVAPNREGERLYTSQTHPYFRAPHIYVALPTRYFKNRNDITDIAFMSTRAGSDRYDRLFPGAFIRPGLGRKRWENRANYVALNVHPTAPGEMSIWHKNGHRYTLRTDGFISINAGINKGTMETRLLRFDGKHLQLNISTAAGGIARVEILDANRQAINGFSLGDCDPIIDDRIDYRVSWKGKKDVSSLAGQPVRLRFEMQEADLYSLRFAP